MSPNAVQSTDQSPPSTSGTDLIRIRDNQRRSRARRKEYLQELESKLRKCEALGVQASVDIQLAARGVSEENARLREENVKLKEENERLKRMMRQSEDVAGAMASLRNKGSSVARSKIHGVNKVGDIAFQQTRESQLPSTNPIGVIHNQGDAIAGSSSVGSTSAHLHAYPLSKTPEDIYHATNNQSMHPTGATSHACIIPEQSEPSSQASYSQTNDDLPFGDDTSLCEYAAHIITSMRADVSTDEVRADLGCGSDVRQWRTCTVDNSKLFTAVDRYTG